MDFIRPLWKKPIPEAKEALLMKIIVFISGIIFVALMYLVDYMGSLFQVYYLDETIRRYFFLC